MAEPLSDSGDLYGYSGAGCAKLSENGINISGINISYGFPGKVMSFAISCWYFGLAVPKKFAG